MKNKKLLILWYTLGTLLFYASHCKAQYGSETDFEAWFGATYQLKLDKRWDMKLSTQVRPQYEYGEEVRLNRFLVEWETSYDPKFAQWLKPLELNLGLRYIGANKKEFTHYWRLHTDLSYQLELKRWKITYRFRFQTRQELWADDAFYLNYSARDYRNLLRVKYNIRKWKLDPEIWAELFYHDELGALNGFSDLRLGIRTTYNINKHHSLGFRYFIEQELRYFRPETTHIFGVFYKYKVKLKKKK